MTTYSKNTKEILLLLLLRDTCIVELILLHLAYLFKASICFLSPEENLVGEGGRLLLLIINCI